jgi:hypothetical protein
MTENFSIGKGVRRAGLIQRYRRKPGDPVHRPLQIYSTDPVDSALDGARVMVNVPYEELRPGPIGSLFEVIGLDRDSRSIQLPVDLDDPRILCTSGLAPSPSAHFQMQMTYAVAMTTYDAFRQALGRDPYWGFDTDPGKPARLKIFPFFMKEQNAFYDRAAAAVQFGWFESPDQVGKQGLDQRLNKRNLRKGKVYTSLSHDIIAHEVSHALLDGLRPNFLKPYHKDTLALHEAFADLVAVFQHFSHCDLLLTAIVRTRGNLQESHLLTEIARQFGQTQSNPSLSLRTAVDALSCDEDGCRLNSPMTYDARDPIHKLGSVLVSSVFEAYTKIFDRKSRKYIKIATQGKGILPQGELEQSLAEVLAKEASELASQFLTICIRAIDYCPPVAVTFGDYLRAMITADFDLVPDDPYDYREALIDAFVLREIPIEDVETLSAPALIWETQNEEVDESLVAAIQHEYRDFASHIDPIEKYESRAKLVGKFLFCSKAYASLKLIRPDALPEKCKSAEIPRIESARVSRRVSPDGRLEMDLVVEITQNLDIMHQGKLMPAIHGCTVICDSCGQIRYVIHKDALQYVAQLEDRQNRNEFNIHDFWSMERDRWMDQGRLMAKIHANA